MDFIFCDGNGADSSAGAGLHITLHLDEPKEGWFPKPGLPQPVDHSREIEIEDHAKREREIKNEELLAAATIKHLV